MDRNLITGLSLTSLLFAAVFLMASDDTNNSYRSIKKITYHFQDASVPPEYHRSYTVIVDKDRLTITVDSYGDILIAVFYRDPVF